MKKFLALLLAAMMLLCCTTAFADDEDFDSIINETTQSWKDTDVGGVSANSDADIDVLVTETDYADAGKFDKEGEMATELWLQVDATGQIDATVPLVLVFQTNIDGGSATSPDAYKITNNSTADLVVTKIATTEVATDTTTGKQPMEMVAYNATLTEDQYKVQLRADKVVGTNTTAVLGKDESGVYDLKTASHANPAHEGGLFELKKAAKNGAGTDTIMKVDMATGKLSFVTSRTEADAMDTTKGIQLLTITYTVAIDTSDAIGEAITTESTDATTVLKGANDATSHTKIVEKTASGATKDQADVNTPKVDTPEEQG